MLFKRLFNPELLGVVLPLILALIIALLDYFFLNKANKPYIFFRWTLIILIFLSIILVIINKQTEDKKRKEFEDQLSKANETILTLTKSNNVKLDANLENVNKIIDKTSQVLKDLNTTNQQTNEILNTSLQIKYPLPKEAKVSFEFEFGVDSSVSKLLDSISEEYYNLKIENVFYGIRLHPSWIESIINFNDFSNLLEINFARDFQPGHGINSVFILTNNQNNMTPFSNYPGLFSNDKYNIEIIYNKLSHSITLHYINISLLADILPSRIYTKEYVIKSILELENTTLSLRLKHPKSISNPKILNFELKSHELTIAKDSLAKLDFGPFYVSQIMKSDL